MVQEYDISGIGQWILSNVPIFFVLAGILALVGMLIGFVVGAQRAGPGTGLTVMGQGLLAGFDDLRKSSWRRTMAMSRLAVKESLRSYVLVILLVFLFVLMFAGWFLDERADNPTRLYLSFVLKTMGFLTVLMAIFLSAFSLPNDLKNKTIYTVVTKPVRGWEIILGRVIGFGTVGTLILAAMGVVSYIWVVRAVQHTHDALPNELRRDPVTNLIQGRTTFDREHRHDLVIDETGAGQTLTMKGHYHPVQIVDESADEIRAKVGAATGALQARVPIYGRLQFLDRTGQPAKQGINVGKEWTYRGFIEGSTPCAGIFRFEGLRSSDFPDGLPLEMTIRVFRTYKGEIERGIRGTMLLRNPAVNDPAAWAEATQDADVAKESEPITFFASDMSSESLLIDRRIDARMPDDTLREVDLFESLVHNGALEIVVQCDERGQYYGMARTDLYLRASDRLFGFNFFKTCVTLWLRMLIVIAFGVMFSTVLSGPVAMLSTVAVIVLGFFARFVTELAQGKLPGGGPIESLSRIVRQDNMVVEWDVDPVTKVVVQMLDKASLLVLQGVSSMMPNFGDFSERGGIETTRFVAYGFDIPWNLSAQHVLAALAYVTICVCIGYFLLKSREVAA